MNEVVRTPPRVAGSDGLFDRIAGVSPREQAVGLPNSPLLRPVQPEGEKVLVPELDSKSGIVRALTVLEHVRSALPRTMGVTEIARELGMAKAVTYRILKDLVLVGFLSFDDRTKEYSLGKAAVLLGVSAFQSTDIVSMARSRLSDLVAATGETATISIRQEWTRVYIDQLESPQEIRMAVQLGARYPLHSGASSKAILAALVPAEVEVFLQLRESLGLGTEDRAALLDDLESTRRRGYSLSLGEREASAISVACPIYSGQGDVWGAISVCGPRTRYEPATWERHGATVNRVATEISLGRRPFA